MAVTKVTDFEQYIVKNAHIRFMENGVLGEAKPLGCTGTLTIETEMTTVQKLCSGQVLKETTKATKLNGTASLHMRPDVAIDVFGLTNEGLKAGVYGYNGKKTARGVITFDVYDMYEEQKQLLAFPNVNFSAGLSINIESGGEEVAQSEIPFSGLQDEEGWFYYQAFEQDVEDEAIITAWHTAFEPQVVQAVPVI